MDKIPTLPKHRPRHRVASADDKTGIEEIEVDTKPIEQNCEVAGDQHKILSHRPQLEKRIEHPSLDVEEAVENDNNAKNISDTEKTERKSPQMPKGRPSIKKRLSTEEPSIPKIPSHHPKGRLRSGNKAHDELRKGESEQIINDQTESELNYNDEHHADESESSDKHIQDVSTLLPKERKLTDDISFNAVVNDTPASLNCSIPRKSTTVSANSESGYDTVIDMYKKSPESPISIKDDTNDSNDASEMNPERNVLDQENTCSSKVPTPRRYDDNAKGDLKLSSVLLPANTDGDDLKERKAVHIDKIDAVKSKTENPEADLSQNVSSVKKSKTISEISLEKKVQPPKPKKKRPMVPKKPSSKIAQFQAMLQQQQEHDLGFLNKRAPVLPSHRPRKHDLASASYDNHEPEKDASREQFSSKLNGMFGMKMNGIPLPGMVLPEVKSQMPVSRSDSGKKEPSKPQSRQLGARRRARAPRGRRLPKSVGNVVEVNDETLGTKTKFTVFAEDSWKMDFEDPEMKNEGDSTRPEDSDIKAEDDGIKAEDDVIKAEDDVIKPGDNGVKSTDAEGEGPKIVPNKHIAEHQTVTHEQKNYTNNEDGTQIESSEDTVHVGLESDTPSLDETIIQSSSANLESRSDSLNEQADVSEIECAHKGECANGNNASVKDEQVDFEEDNSKDSAFSNTEISESLHKQADITTREYKDAPSAEKEVEQ
ncbi:hypothetical protein HII12_003495 [Brettanomyces bruxellensis]|uniref:Altered inheritance of mitochondria protein 21 n=1 Tax=Dekkera bruxellensis TaxID=5007 RepID=A0A8H6BEN4_DEKBR|nr:hypothetical protein HII12_003495 [Brettanomyces bruxellensis]